MTPKPEHPGKSGQAPGHQGGGPVGDEWGERDQHHRESPAVPGREGPTYPRRRGVPHIGDGKQGKGCLWGFVSSVLSIPLRFGRWFFGLFKMRKKG